MRGITAFVLVFLLLWTAATAWAAAELFGAMRRGDAVEVRVSGTDGRVAFALPAFLAEGIIRHASRARIDCDDGIVWTRHDAEAWAPALRATLAELEAYDDVPLLEIVDHGSTVKMHKHGGRFVLEVEDGDERVKVVMPLRTLRRALEEV